MLPKRWYVFGRRRCAKVLRLQLQWDMHHSHTPLPSFTSHYFTFTFTPVFTIYIAFLVIIYAFMLVFFASQIVSIQLVLYLLEKLLSIYSVSILHISAKAYEYLIHKWELYNPEVKEYNLKDYKTNWN